jgi:hypothetical protein
MLEWGWRRCHDRATGGGPDVDPAACGIPTLATKRGIAPDALRLGRRTTFLDADGVAH